MRTILDFNGKEIEITPVETYKAAGTFDISYSIMLTKDPTNPMTISITYDQMKMLELVALLLKETK